MKRILGCLAGLALSACVTTPKPVQVEPQPEVGQVLAEEDRLADLMFHMLRGEIAGRLGDLEQALTAYTEAMRLSDDPGLAERAARVALYLDRRDAAQEAAARWLVLEPESADAHEVLGLIALRRGNQPDAVAQFKAMIDAGVSEEASIERLTYLLAREDAEPALRVLEALTASYPKQPRAYYSLAEQALRAEAPELALQAADQALKLAPEWVDPVLVKVRAQMALGQDEAALQLLEQTLEAQPLERELRLEYARALLNLEQSGRALEQFQILLEDQPGDPQTLYAAALLALELEDYERARDYLLRLVNSGARLDEAYLHLGQLAERERDIKGALRWYRQVRGASRPEAELRVAVLLAESGQLDAARQQLAELRADSPALSVRSYLVEGELLRQARRLQNAAEVYTMGLLDHPSQLDLLYARALTWAQLRDVTAAEADLRAVLAEKPEQPLALNALGYTLVDLTDRDQEGLELIQRAYAQSPDDPAIIDSMGWAHYQLGDYQQAQEYLEQAYQLDPAGEIAAHLVEVLWKLGERERARAVFAEALVQHPEDETLLRTKERLGL